MSQHMPETSYPRATEEQLRAYKAALLLLFDEYPPREEGTTDARHWREAALLACDKWLRLSGVGYRIQVFCEGTGVPTPVLTATRMLIFGY